LNHQTKETTYIQDQNNICFFDIRGIIHFEFAPEGTTVNQTFYVEVLKRLIDAVRRKGRRRVVERSLIDSSP
jgi:hypothetical protein